jgi:hypothetical protein
VVVSTSRAFDEPRLLDSVISEGLSIDDAAEMLSSSTKIRKMHVVASRCPVL